MDLFSKKQPKRLSEVLGFKPWRVGMFLAEPGTSHYYIFEDGDKMQITLENGLTISGSQDEVYGVMRKLGYGEQNGKFYNSSSKGLILISEMETSHLRNAVLKLNREWAESLSAINDPGAVADAILCGNDDETFQAMLDELQDREDVPF